MFYVIIFTSSYLQLMLFSINVVACENKHVFMTCHSMKYHLDDFNFNNRIILNKKHKGSEHDFIEQIITENVSNILQ